MTLVHQEEHKYKMNTVGIRYLCVLVKQEEIGSSMNVERI